jgi:H+/gluconate symporter-like permease
MQVAVYVVAVLAFLAIYALLHARAKRQGTVETVRWQPILAILLCAAAAVVLGSVLR